MILIALGANLPSFTGEPHATLMAALAELETRGVHVRRRSRFYVSPAWPDESDPPFVNAVAEVRTAMTPDVLLRTLHEVETHFGRKRSMPNAPRTLDLDLIDYEGRIEDGPPHLPHPRMADRLFVLMPLKDVAPDWRHPLSGASVAELIAAAPGRISVLDGEHSRER